MALNSLKCNHLMPPHFKVLTVSYCIFYTFRCCNKLLEDFYVVCNFTDKVAFYKISLLC